MHTTSYRYLGSQIWMKAEDEFGVEELRNGGKKMEDGAT